MPSYIVYFEGEITVEANDEEDAKYEAWAYIPNDVTITDVELDKDSLDCAELRRDTK